MLNLFPRSREEALAMFSEEDAPLDCHNHCDHFETDGECCDCGEKKQVPVPVKEFFESEPGRPIQVPDNFEYWE